MAVVSEVSAWITAAQLTGDPRWLAVNLPDQITADDVCQMATDYLYAASGRRYGVRTDTIRPMRLSSMCDCAADVFRWGAEWGVGVGWWWMPTAFGCGCGVGSEFLLPAEVAGTVTVSVEGANFTQFAIYDNRRLVRTDGQVWPCCQQLQNPLGSKGTWSITYAHGAAPPRNGVIAAHEMALELATLLSGKPNRLNNRVTQVNRTGQTMSNAMPDYFRDGLTGIPVVDAFLLAANPHGLARNASILSPDDIVGVLS